MSVERRGDGWRVRWRDEQGQARTRQFKLKRDAETVDAEIKRRKHLGDALPYQQSQTLSQFWEDWREQYGVPRLAPKTLAVYDLLWSKHLEPALGHMSLKAIGAEHIDRLRAKLTTAGLADGSVRKNLAVLQGVLQRAVEWQRIPMNPARLVARPQRQAQRQVKPLTWNEVRRLTAPMSRRDELIVLTLAWTGLRPGELRALCVSDLGPVLMVSRAISGDAVRPTKTRRNRTLPLEPILLNKLRSWIMETGTREYVFPGIARDGGEAGRLWTDRGWAAWQREHFTPAATKIGRPDLVPYDLRHTYVSELIRAGVPILEIARRAGHSPVHTLETYGHIFDEVGVPDVSAATPGTCHLQGI